MESILQTLTSQYAQLLTYALATLAALAFTVSVITEVTKNIGFLGRIPTALQVLILSIVICQLAYLIGLSYMQRQVAWYGPVIAFVMAFYVAFLAMYGWEKLAELWGRYKKPGGSA
ncbi:hypothetical protein [Enterocloster lavalensis]|uniref:hypothetical protein n=1 Tax=Enterocloster lavalensis TaxID=460384 RepID=UPI001D06EE42|nr:hypothetical protein [Enterocloster lavalensis]MCB6345403.1 hypothetical protein [Enterocloster lavalensis]